MEKAGLMSALIAEALRSQPRQSATMWFCWWNRERRDLTMKHLLILIGLPVALGLLTPAANAAEDRDEGSAEQASKERTMNRIPYPDPETLSAEKRAYLDNPELRILNIARISMHAPDPIWKATVDMAIAVVTNTQISDYFREIIVLRVAHLSHSEYELFHHLSMGKAVGLSDEIMAGLESGDFSAFPEKERLIAQFTTEVVRDVSPTDETVAAMRAQYSDEEIFEMLGIIGSYMNAARVAAIAQIENDDIAVKNWDEERDVK
jgi:4-carboxymuconolactone decarboxylase